MEPLLCQRCLKPKPLPHGHLRNFEQQRWDAVGGKPSDELLCETTYFKSLFFPSYTIPTNTNSSQPFLDHGPLEKYVISKDLPAQPEHIHIPVALCCLFQGFYGKDGLNSVLDFETQRPRGISAISAICLYLPLKPQL